MSRPAPAPPDESNRKDNDLFGLLRRLGNDANALIRQEIELLKAEVRANLRGVATGTGRLAAGGIVLVVGLLVLIGFLVAGLGALLGGEYWLSALIVAIGLLAAGGGLGYLGVRRLSSLSVAPAMTVQSVGESAEWAKQEVAELRNALSGGGRDGGDPAHRTSVVLAPAAPGSDRGGRGGDQDEVVPAALEADEAPAKPGRPSLALPLHRRVVSEIRDDDVTGQAAKVAFYMFSSVPPALLVIFGMTGFFGGEAVDGFLEQRMQGVLPGSPDDPGSAAGYLSEFIDQVVHERAPGPFSIGLLLGLWASSAVFVALADALNRAFDVTESRSWVRKRATAIGVMLGFALLFLCGSIVLIGGPAIADALRLGGAGDVAWAILQWPLAFLLVVCAFFKVYYILPDRDQTGCRGVLFRSSAIAAGLWLLATLGFRIYITNFGSYSETYGFVGAVLVLLLWMYLTALVLLVGGEVASEMERSR